MIENRFGIEFNEYRLFSMIVKGQGFYEATMAADFYGVNVIDWQQVNPDQVLLVGYLPSSLPLSKWISETNRGKGGKFPVGALLHFTELDKNTGKPLENNSINQVTYKQ